MLAEYSQLYGRTPNPSSTRGSTVVLGVGWPKFVSERLPHSPLASTFVRSQSGEKFPAAGIADGIHQVVPGPGHEVGQPVHRRDRVAVRSLHALRDHVLVDARLERGSSVAEEIVGQGQAGVMSFQLTSSVSGRSRFLFGTSGAGSRCCAGMRIFR